VEVPDALGQVVDGLLLRLDALDGAAPVELGEDDELLAEFPEDEELKGRALVSQEDTCRA
jgi:hypothetical protein